MDPRPGTYIHVLWSNTRKRAASGTWIHVQGPTATCTGRSHGKGRALARGSTSFGLQPRGLVEHAEKGRHWHMDQRPGAYSHVIWSNTRKRAASGTWIHVQVPTAWCGGRTRGKGRPLARGPTSRGLQPRALVEHEQKGGHWHVDPRPGAYSHVDCSNKRKSVVTGTWIQVHGPKATCTSRTRGKGRQLARRSTSWGLQPRAPVEHEEKSEYWQVDPRPGTCCHVHWSNTRKNASTCT